MESVKFVVDDFLVMRWQFMLSLLFLLLSQVVFLGLAAYYTEIRNVYPGGDITVSPSVGYSWIWYHLESWIISLVLSIVALAMFVWGMIAEIRQSGWKLSNQTKIKEEEN